MVARRALRAEGELSLDGPPLVVELLPAANIAAGEAEHSLGAVLAERLPGTRSVVVREGEAPAVVARQLLIVLRDAHRHEWMREAADTLLGRAPNAVVVETGVPVWRPDGARGYVATLGGSRVGYEALAELLAGSRNGAGA
jgi:beta-N-acetylhexosaminidase